MEFNDSTCISFDAFLVEFITRYREYFISLYTLITILVILEVKKIYQSDYNDISSVNELLE